MEVKTKKSFNSLLGSLVEEILDEEDLDEMNATASVGGSYMTPMAFNPKGKKKKKKKKKKIGEALDSKDLEIIKKLIRNVISDVYRDIWIKRNSWK